MLQILLPIYGVEIDKITEVNKLKEKKNKKKRKRLELNPKMN